MKKPIISLLILLNFTLLFCPSIKAQKNLYTKVADYITNSAVSDSLTRVTLLDADSTFVDSAAIGNGEEEPGKRRQTYVGVFVPYEGDFILKIENPDYETCYYPFHLKNYKRELDFHLPTIKIRRILRKELSEAAVTASKIQFYFNKDTLGYNASAFITQDGFALNDILQKMPGLRIDKDGTIYSNGQKVDVLCLNGKDFFNSDRLTLLENLPAYTVKNIKIYEKKKNDTLSIKNIDKQYIDLVMDVRLKREYSSTTMANVNIGFGTNKHYYGRAFFMNFSDRHRFSAYAGSNDINRNENIGRNGEVRDTDNGTGKKKFHFAGLNYNVEHPDEKYSLSGDLRVQKSKEERNTRQFVQKYYADGDIFDIMNTAQTANNFSLQTNHTLTFFQNKPYSFTVSPSVLFTQSKGLQEIGTITAESNLVDSLGSNWLDSLRSRQLCETMKLYGISRTNQQNKHPSSSSQIKLGINKSIKIPHSFDILTISTFGMRSHISKKAYEQNAIDYIRQGAPSLWKNLYHDNGVTEWVWNGTLSYLYLINTNHSITAQMQYEHVHFFTNSDFYNLELLEGWGQDSCYPIGQLPPEEDMRNVFDLDNSMNYKENSNRYALSLNYSYSKEVHHLSVNVPFKLQYNSLVFQQQKGLQQVNHRMRRPELSIDYTKWRMGQTGTSFTAKYDLSHSMPTLFYFVDYTNAANPMIITRGNPDLKNGTRHHLEGSVSYSPKIESTHSLLVSYDYRKNDVVKSLLFNRDTGVYTQAYSNISGNQSLWIFLNNSGHLTKNRKNLIANKITVSLADNVGFSGTSESEAAQKNTVHNYDITEELSYTFKAKNTRYRFSVAPYFTYLRSVSAQKNFDAINAYNYGLKLNAYVELFWNMRLNTELKSVSRRGYNEKDMNDDEYLWNLNLTKAFKKNITLSIEAVDILNQRKSVYRFVTGQGYVEQFSNNLRRYAMLHFVWQFAKKKQQ